MEKEEAKKRIAKLKSAINHYRYLYHVKDISKISDEALDSLKKELFNLEQTYPDLITPDSPTQRIGGKPLKKFEKFTHPTRMTSFNDAFSKEDLEDWLNRNLKLLTKEEAQNIDFYVEPKLDGLAIELIYKNGVLETGATRGDGYIGENVTQNLKTIESIPLKLRKKTALNEIIVRGEAVLTKKEFERINKIRLEKGKQPYANPRNLAAGSIRQLNPEITRKRKLSADFYSLVSNLGQRTHNEEHQILAELGFKTNNKYNKVCKTIDEVMDYYKDFIKKRESLPYEVDGIVVSINDNKIAQKLGIVGKAPRSAIAFKFPQKQAVTILEDVEFQIGRTGVVTPVSILKPVNVEGVTISRATLHNEDEIKRLGLKIKDTVVIGRAGDVIPKIIKVLKELRQGHEKEIVFPKKCPACKGPLVKKDALWYCLDEDCFKRKYKEIVHFVSKPAFDIVSLGPNIIKKLLENKLIVSASDLFTLKKGDLLELEGFQEKLSENIIHSIQKSKNITLPRFLLALSIKNVGIETANILADKFQSIENIEKAEKEELENIYDIGEVVAESIYSFFKDKQNLAFIEKLFKNGVTLIYEKKQDKFKGFAFVFTGTLLKTTRDKAKESIRSLGGNISDTVSKNTDFLISGKNPGSKYNQAKKLGIKILNEEEFYELIRSS